MKRLWTDPSHHDVISANTQDENTGTYSILFRMVLRSAPPVFSFILIFFQTSKNAPMLYWTITEWVRCREPVSVDYQRLTKPHLGCTVTLLLVHLAGAHSPDLMLKLTSCHGPDQRSSQSGFGHSPDFTDPWFTANKYIVTFILA